MGKGSSVDSSSHSLPPRPCLKATSLISEEGLRGQLRDSPLLWEQLMQVAIAVGSLTESSLGPHSREVVGSLWKG